MITVYEANCKKLFDGDLEEIKAATEHDVKYQINKKYLKTQLKKKLKVAKKNCTEHLIDRG